MSQSPLRIAIAGLGTVGASTARILKEQQPLLAARAGRPLEVVAVSARDQSRDRGVDFSDCAWEADATALAARDDVDLVVELIGGSEGVAKTLCENALSSGKHVVTANKALIAHHGMALAQTAEQNGLGLACEAAVTAAIPILQSIRQGLSGNVMQRVVGIMNGTCNYMLTQMEETGGSFDAILKDAQDLGFAEADPSFDVDGIDTAHKLAILTSLAFGTTLDFDAVHVEGIRGLTPLDIEYAAKLGYRIKLLGIARRVNGCIEQRVHPCMVGLDQPMARVPAEYNAVETQSDAAGKMFFEGAGAGGDATASAVISDIIDIARGHVQPLFSIPAASLSPLKSLSINDHIGSVYIRLSVTDRPGVLTEVSRMFFEENVSVKSCIQHGEAPDEVVQLAVITHETAEASLTKALTRIGELECITETPHMIRIENL